MFLDRLDTTIGTLLVVTDDDGTLRAVDWSDHLDRFQRLLKRHYGATVPVERRGKSPATRALGAYFAGNLAAIDALAVATNGTPFQQEVWRTLRDIPAGTTITYTELARRCGHSAAVRAAGFANGQNPIGIVVPCHRVVGSDGSLTGYGGGLHRKRWLLRHEGAIE